MTHFVRISIYIGNASLQPHLYLINHLHLTFEVTTCEITQFNTPYLAVRLHFGDHTLPCALISKTVLNK